MPKTHGKRYTKLYYIWSNMKDRCLNKNCKNYPSYGERGIKICENWLCFEDFYEWSITNGYKEGLSIDRIDNDGDYCPENCRWTTMKQQCYNRRSNHYIEYNGKTQTITQWAEEYGLTEQVLSSRLRKGWDMDKALIEPKREIKKLEFNGRFWTISELSKEYNIKKYTIENRLKRNWDIDKIVNTPETQRKSE